MQSFNNFNKTIPIGNNKYRVMPQDKYAWGIYDAQKGRYIIPCEYRGILYYEKWGVYVCQRYGDGKNPGLASVIDENNRYVIPPKYESISIQEDGFYKISFFNRKVGHGFVSGAINQQGQLVVQPMYMFVWKSSNGLYFVIDWDEKRCGFVKNNGYSDLEYSNHRNIYETSWDCISYDIDESDKPYREIKRCKPSLIIAEKNRKWGVISLTGEIIIPIEYDSIKEEIESIKEWEPSEFWDEDKAYIEFEKFSSTHKHYLSLKKGNITTNVNFDGNPYLIIPKQHNIDSITALNEQNIQPITHTPPSRLNTLHNTQSGIAKPPQKYLFFDTETTGIPTNYNAPISDLKNWPRLVQIAWIVCDEKGENIESVEHIIRPHGFIIPKGATSLHGISTEIAMREGKDLKEVLMTFAKLAKESKVLVGHNLSFDINIVGAELIRTGIECEIQNKSSICTMKSSVNYCALPGKFGYKWPTLEELYYKLFGKSFFKAHSAMNDVKATKKCFFELKRRNLI